MEIRFSMQHEAPDAWFMNISSSRTLSPLEICIFHAAERVRRMIFAKFMRQTSFAPCV
jgi:hypothetical protein